MLKKDCEKMNRSFFTVYRVKLHFEGSLPLNRNDQSFTWAVPGQEGSPQQWQQGKG